MRFTSLALLALVYCAGLADAPKTSEPAAFDVICRGLEANSPAIRSYRVAMQIKSWQELPTEFLGKKAPSQRTPGEPRPQEATVRCLSDSAGRVRCECETETASGDDRPAPGRHPPFTAVLQGGAVRRLETRTSARGTTGRLGKIVNQSPRVFYQGINPREFVIDLEGRPAAAFLEEHHAKVAGASEWDSAPVVVVETEAIPDGAVERMMRVMICVDKNYAIVKTAACIRRVGGSEWTEYSIKESHDHYQDPSGVWLPRRAVSEMWAVSTGDGKKPLRLSRYEVEFSEFELDPKIPDSAFELPFPEKTVVQDDITGRHYVAAELTDQLLADQIAKASEERGLLPAPPRRSRAGVIAVTVVSFVFLAAVLFRARRSGRRRDGPATARALLLTLSLSVACGCLPGCFSASGVTPAAAESPKPNVESDRRSSQPRKRARIADPENPCGVVSLSIATRYFGKPATLAKVRSFVAPDALGRSSMLELIAAAKSLGLAATGVKLSNEACRKWTSPYIAHVRDSHFVVVVPKPRGVYAVLDPPFPVRFMSADRLREKLEWDGSAILLAGDIGTLDGELRHIGLSNVQPPN